MRDSKNTARDLFRGKIKIYLPEFFSMFLFLSFEMGHILSSKKIKGVFGCVYTTEKCGKGPPIISTIPTNFGKKYRSFHRAMGTYGLDWSRPCLTMCKRTFHHFMEM